MTDVRPEKAWAAFCTDGYPRAFISTYAIHHLAREVRQAIGEMHAGNREDWRAGWKRAYRRGWRVVRVEVTKL